MGTDVIRLNDGRVQPAARRDWAGKQVSIR